MWRESTPSPSRVIVVRRETSVDAPVGDVCDEQSSGVRAQIEGGYAHRTANVAVAIIRHHAAGWSSQVARRAHNPEVAGSNPAPATGKAPETGPFSFQRLNGPRFRAIRAGSSRGRALRPLLLLRQPVRSLQPTISRPSVLCSGENFLPELLPAPSDRRRTWVTWADGAMPLPVLPDSCTCRSSTETLALVQVAPLLTRSVD